MKKFILIDGSSMLTTNYYGSAPKRFSEETDDEYYARLRQVNGTYTNGVAVTLKVIASILSEQKPDYFAIAFDQSRQTTFRKKLYPAYKDQRVQKPEPLQQQFETMKKILTRINVPWFESADYEADDIIGTLAKRYASDDTHVFCITKDHDYFQLADKNITIWMPQSSQEKADELFMEYGIIDEKDSVPYKCFPYTPERIFMETGVDPCQIPDLKGLQGDSSDNLPGVKGVCQAASIMLEEYDTLENIYKALEADEAKFLKDIKATGINRSPVNALKNGKANGMLSKNLAVIVTDIKELQKDVPWEAINNISYLETALDVDSFNSVLKDYALEEYMAPLDPLSFQKTNDQLYNDHFNLIVGGSRTFEDYELFKAKMDFILGNKEKIRIISGGAQGTDLLAKRYAKEKSYGYTEFAPDGDTFKKQEMFDEAAKYPDHASVLFWDMKSPGTKNSIELAKKRGFTYKVFNCVDKKWAKNIF